MGRSFLPTADASLLAFAQNFSTLLTANYAAYNVAQSVATAYAATFTTYQTALEAAQAPPTRGNATVQAKKTAKHTLITVTRQVARTIGNNMDVTDAQRQALGLTIRKTHSTPVPTPTVRPRVSIGTMYARTVTAYVFSSAPGSGRGKPAGVQGAKVYTFVGASYPSDPTLWAYNGDATRDKYPITFPDSVASGAQVWVCAAYYNAKGETGPISVPVTTNIQGGGAQQQQELKIAA